MPEAQNIDHDSYRQHLAGKHNCWHCQLALEPVLLPDKTTFPVLFITLAVKTTFAAHCNNARRAVFEVQGPLTSLGLKGGG